MTDVKAPTVKTARKVVFTKRCRVSARSTKMDENVPKISNKVTISVEILCGVKHKMLKIATLSEDPFNEKFDF